jgi:hypothetical protein
VLESQVVKEWTDLARKDGLKDGKKERLREAKVDTLLRILRRIKLELPADLEQSIRILDDLARLDMALDAGLG